MTYIDCYLVPVPIENRAAYEELARISAQVLREYGAMRVVECWLDHSSPEASSYHESEARLDSEQYGTFIQAAGARKGETVVMSFVEWPDQNRGQSTVFANIREFCALTPIFLCALTPIFLNMQKFF